MFVECREYPLCVKESTCPHCDGCNNHCTCVEDYEQKVFEELAESDNFGNGSDDDSDVSWNDIPCMDPNCRKSLDCPKCDRCHQHCMCDMDGPIEISEFFDEDFE